MSFFSKLFRKRKKEPTFEEIEQDLVRDENAYPVSASHAAVDGCEELIELARELEDARSEYRVVTAYLSDVEKLQELPDNEKKALSETAEQVVKLTQDRSKLLSKEKKISDVVFREMEREEKRMPDVIERYAANEAYLATLERDMNYLENEKVQWEMYGEDYRDSTHRYRILLRALFSTAIAFVVMMLVLEFAFNLHLITLFVILCAVLAIAGFFVYLKLMREEREILQCDVNLNHAIKLLNKVRIKYVNIKNAVDYTAEKYHVRSSRELLKTWEDYQEAVRERARFAVNSQDLSFYSEKLLKLLRGYGLYDATVWISTPEALVDSREMVEVKHNMIVRRQKLRQRIEYGTDKIKEERRHIEKLLEKDPAGREEMENILKTIDKILGDS